MFAKKSIRIEVQLNEGEFKEGQSSIINFKGLPMDVVINRVAFYGINFSANIRIYGVTKEHLDTLTRIKWRDMWIPQKAVRVFVNNGYGERLLYEGNIMSANPVYATPNVYIDIQSVAGTSFTTKSGIPPSTLKGEVPVPLIFKKICDDYGISLVEPPDEINGMCRDPYFDQNGLAKRLKAAGFAYNVVTFLHNDRVELRPASSDYFHFKNWTFTPEHFIGYPKYTDSGIEIILDEAIDVEQGDVFEIKDSVVTGANREWIVNTCVFNLSTKIGGNWFMKINGSIYVR